MSTSVSTATSSKARIQVSSSTEKVTVTKSGALMSTPLLESMKDDQYLPNKSHKRGQEQAGSGKQLSNKVSHISTSSNSQGRNLSVSPVPSNQSLYDGHVTSSQDSNDKVCLAHEENVWNTENDDWDGIDLVMLSRYSTDDDKIRKHMLCVC